MSNNSRKTNDCSFVGTHHWGACGPSNLRAFLGDFAPRPRALDFSEHEPRRTWCMYYDHIPCMYYDHSTNRIRVYACIMIMVHSCSMIIVLACTMIIVHACTMIIVHVSCPTRRIFDAFQVGGGVAEPPGPPMAGARNHFLPLSSSPVQKSHLRRSQRLQSLLCSLAGWDMIRRWISNIRSWA